MVHDVAQWVNEAINWLAATLGVEGQLIVNVLILLLVIALVAWRIREEIRSGKWIGLSPAERRERIMIILNEAWDYAEWLFSHLDPVPKDAKPTVAALKRKAAIDYAKRELRAAGAGQKDVRTVPVRLEYVGSLKNRGKKRSVGPELGA